MSLLLRTIGPDPAVYGPDGIGVLVPPGKPLAALCLIALEAGPVTRDDLIGFLWSTSSTSRGRASARQALHVLRKALGAEVLLEDAGTLALSDGVLRSDLSDLESTLARGDVESAYARWQGGPFSQFSLADAPAFNEWADELRGRWEQRLGHLLEDYAAQLRDQGDVEAALLWMSRALEVRPFREAIHVDEVELLLRLDRLDHAEEALQRAFTVLDEPTPGILEELETRIHRLRRARVAAMVDGSAPPELSFVGRTKEMAELRRHWRSVRSGRPRTVAIIGEAGVGKTRLAREFVRNSTVDAVTVEAKALDLERGIDFGLTSELVRGLIGKPGAAGISSGSLAVLQQIAPSIGAGDGIALPGRPTEAALADALLDLVEAVAHEAPVVLLVDDLQWADTSSRTLLLKVLRSLRGLQVLTLVTCRSGDADLSAVRLLRAETTARRATLLELDPLTSSEVLETLGLSLRVVPEAETEEVAHRLHSACRGNPLFLNELVLRLHQDGVVEGDDEGWVLHTARLPRDLPLPGSIREILEARIGVLDDDARTVLSTLARLGDADGEALSRRCGLPRPQVDSVASSLLKSGLVTWGGGEKLTLSHDALRDVARQVLPPPPHQRSGFRKALAVAAAALVLVVATAFFVLREGRAPLYPGIIYVSRGDRVERFRVPTRRGESWDTLPSVVLPDGVTGTWLAPRLDGGFNVFGTVHSERGVPSAVQVLPSGQARTLLPSDGDVMLEDLSPDGRFALVGAGHESDEGWHIDLVRVELATGETLRLLELPGKGFGYWLRDGTSIVAISVGQPDSVFRVRPDGVRLGATAVSGTNGNGWGRPCSPGGSDLVRFEPTDAGTTLHLLDLASNQEVDKGVMSMSVYANSACSPDGRGLVWVTTVRGEKRLMTYDLQTGDTLLGPSVDLVGAVHWTAERLPPVPVMLRIPEDSLSLEWGTSRHLDDETLLADGTHISGEGVVWTVRDAGVASVDAHGTLFANAVGDTYVVGTVQGWIADSLMLHVTSASLPREALISDPFREFDADRWYVFGQPGPIQVMTDAGPAVDLNGDGVGADGILSRKSFDLTRGATLELDYRLPLTRQDRQAFGAGLVAFGKEPGEPLDRFIDSQQEQTVLFLAPPGEFASFDPASFLFSSGGIAAQQRAPDALPANTWVHLAIVLTPDGKGRLLLNHKEVAHLQYPVHLAPDVRWRVQLTSRAADTKLLVRNLVLWEGARY